jgi:diaminopimelate decarboxylase
VPTPFYAYSAGAIRRRIESLKRALYGLYPLICFAVKANSSIAILRLMAEAGLGADIVSEGELRRALRAGVPANRIVFSGVGKTEDEIAAALAAGIWRFNVESADELECLQRVARARRVIANAALRINPDVDAHTHQKISTGKAENKFGIGIAEARRLFAGAAEHSYVRLDGLHVHIGSQILSLEPFCLALERIAEFQRELTGAGHSIRSIDVGGGLGVRYRSDQEEPVTQRACC